MRLLVLSWSLSAMLWTLSKLMLSVIPTNKTLIKIFNMSSFQGFIQRIKCPVFGPQIYLNIIHFHKYIQISSFTQCWKVRPIKVKNSRIAYALFFLNFLPERNFRINIINYTREGEKMNRFLQKIISSKDILSQTFKQIS